MAPVISVPANFGKHHLNSHSHNNLELLCADGETQRANSMILSFNSRVIDDLITTLEITSLDMQDFNFPAVKSFVESMYSGELEDCDKSKFRQLNKMGKVFDVKWFVERCSEYYKDLVEVLNVRSYQDIEYVVEEAIYAQDKLKDSKFTTLILEKLDALKSKKSIFLKEYAKDLDKISMSQLEMVVKIAGKDVGILVSILVNHLETNKCSIETEPTRSLFKNIDFSKTFASNRYKKVTNQLFDVLLLDRNDTNPEFKCALECLYKSLNKDSSTKNHTKPENLAITKYPVEVVMPANEFLKLDWISLLEYLAQCSEVTSLTLLFDALYTWLWGEFESGDGTGFPRIKSSDTEDFVKNIVDITQDRGWSKVSRKYLRNITAPQDCPIGIKALIDVFLTSNQLLVDDDNKCFVFTCSRDLKLSDLLSNHLKIALVAENNLPSCDKDSKCAVLLETFYQPFRLLFATDVPESDIEDIHYHNIVTEFEEAGLLLTNVTTGVNYPLPFNTPLSYVSEYDWHWGCFSTCNENRVLLTVTPPCLTWWAQATHIRDIIRITAFLHMVKSGETN